MFESFFPRPAAFFLSAFIWALCAIIFWEAGGGDWLLSVTHAAHPLPISAARFWSPAYLAFYGYYWLSVGAFAAFWFMFSPHRWQRWSILGSALIIFVTWFMVDIGVVINLWYAPFNDLIGKALSNPGTIKMAEFNAGIGVFLSIALLTVFFGILKNFFVSHYVFRWRTAMNEHYMAYWQKLRHIEGAAQRVREDTMRFASTLETVGITFITAMITLIAFLPVLVKLSPYITEIPVFGHVAYGLVIVAIVWSLFGTGLLAVVGIKLPGLEFNNQRVEAAYRKELVYGEDDATRALPPTVTGLFNAVRFNYSRLYFHYLYFNVTKALYIQVDVIFGLYVMFPSIIAGTITLGLMTQITNVFSQVRGAFQYLINSWTTLVELASIYKRLRQFERAIDQRELCREGLSSEENRPVKVT